MKHRPYKGVPQCTLRLVLDEGGAWTLHCLVERDGEVVGQLPVVDASLQMSAMDQTLMRLDVLGSAVRVEYAPDPVDS